MRRPIVVLMAVGSLATAALAACGSGSESHGSMDASVPADAPVATDGYSATEGGVDADASMASDAGSTEAGDAPAEASDADAAASEGAPDVLSNLCTTEVFGTLTVLARVEWLPPDFQNNVVHRGVVLYEQGD